MTKMSPIETSGRDPDPDLDHKSILTQEPSTASLMMMPPEILYKIADHLTLPDLKSLRLVNTIWSATATHNILKRSLSTIRFWFCPTRKLFVHSHQPKANFYSSYKVDQEMITLDQFNDHELEKIFAKFPCTHFEFMGGNLASQDVQIFFSSAETHQIQIKTLGHCWSHDDPTDRKTFIDVLQRLAPKVESLIIELFDQVPWPHETIFCLNSLPNLKCLSLGFYTFISNNPPLFKEILNSAVNLQCYHTWFSDVKHIDMFIAARKIYTIKYLKLCLSLQNMEDFEKFADANPTVQEIEIDLQNFQNQKSSENQNLERASKILLKILESSKKVVQVVRLISVASLRGLKWPQMQRLREFKLDLDYYFAKFNSRTTYQIFLPHVKASEIIPGLRILNLSGFHGWGTFERSLGSNYFPFVGILEGVRQLQLSNNIPLTWFKTLNEFLPKLEYLVYKGIRNFPEISSYLYDFKGVKELELEIVVGSKYPSHNFPALDMAFTGLSEEGIKNIQTQGCLPQVTQVQVKCQGISKMTGLEKLNISLRDMDYEAQGSLLAPPMTGIVTGHFAFQSMAGLRVTMEGIAGIQNYGVIEQAVKSFDPFADVQMRRR